MKFIIILLIREHLGRTFDINTPRIPELKLSYLFPPLFDTLPSLLILGIFCGMLMYIAVEGYKRTTNPLIVVLPVMAFILCGFEHCIADMFYFAINCFKGTSASMLVDTLLRLLVITIGNLIGGCLICYASITCQRLRLPSHKP